MDHYIKCAEGQWTFNDGAADEEPIIFRKGSPCDSIKRPGKMYLRKDSTLGEGIMLDWLLAAWGEGCQMNATLMEKALDVLNAYEAEHGPL